MHKLGILMAPDAAVAGLAVGGLTLIERQARSLRRAGCAPLLLVDPEPLTPIPEGVEPVSVADFPARLAHEEARLALVLAPGLVIDGRAIAAVARAEASTILVSDGTLVPAPGVERLDFGTLAAGVLLLPVRQLADVAAGLGDWDLGSILIRLLAPDAAVARLPLESLALADGPMLWQMPQDAASALQAGAAVMAQAPSSGVDAPARYLYRPLEDGLVRLLAPSMVSPAMVTLFAVAMGVLAAAALAMGAMWWGLGLALLYGPLRGVSDKLAYSRLESPRWERVLPVCDMLLEYGWYGCAAFWFSAQQGSALAWALAALMILSSLAAAAQRGFYCRMTGSALDEAGVLERRLALVAGRRNMLLWLWLLFAVFGQWFEGFVALALYSIVTAAVVQWRFQVRIEGHMSRESKASQ